MSENALRTDNGIWGLMAENVRYQNTQNTAAHTGHGLIRLHADTMTMAFGTTTATVHPLYVHAVGGGTGAAADVNVSAFGGNAIGAGAFTAAAGGSSALVVSNIATAGAAPTTVTVGAIVTNTATSAAFVNTIAPVASDSRAFAGVWASQVGAWTANVTASVSNFPTSVAVTNALSVGTHVSISASVINTPTVDVRSASSVTIQAGTINAATITNLLGQVGSTYNIGTLPAITGTVSISTPVSIVGSTLSVNVNTIGSLPQVNVSNALTIAGSTLSERINAREFTNSTNFADLSWRGASSSVAGTTTSIKALDVADLGAGQGAPTIFRITASTYGKRVMSADPTRRAAIIVNAGGVDVFLGGSVLTHGSLATVTASDTGSTDAGVTRGYQLTKQQQLFVPWTGEVWGVLTVATTGSIVVWTAN